MFQYIHNRVRRFTEWIVKTKYLHFFLTGVTGLGLNLFVTWVLTEFILGIERYFTAYIVGVIVNLAFNFTLHVLVTFRTRTHIVKRLAGFVTYSITMTTFQAWIVKTVTPIVGLQYYLVVIGGVIFVFSIVTFTLFKFFLFRKGGGEMPNVPSEG